MEGGVQRRGATAEKPMMQNLPKEAFLDRMEGDCCNVYCNVSPMDGGHLRCLSRNREGARHQIFSQAKPKLPQVNGFGGAYR
eukprot:2964731-Rhodomonas_salina.1